MCFTFNAYITSCTLSVVSLYDEHFIISHLNVFCRFGHAIYSLLLCMIVATAYFDDSEALTEGRLRRTSTGDNYVELAKTL